MVRIVVKCMCSSTEIFETWSSTSKSSLIQNQSKSSTITQQKIIPYVKTWIWRSRYVPLICKRSVFMYCKYSSIFDSPQSKKLWFSSSFSSVPRKLEAIEIAERKPRNRAIKRAPDWDTIIPTNWEMQIWRENLWFLLRDGHLYFLT